MATYGEYAYSNYTLLNPMLDNKNFQSTSYHEYTHMVLTARSCIGMILYCLEKIKVPLDCNEDKIRYKAITQFLNRHTNKVQEGLAVFVECVMKLVFDGVESYENFIDGLQSNNITYYNYVKPLIFIVDKMKEESSKEEILKTANLVFLLGIECMDGELYQEDSCKFITSTTIQKMISKPEFSSKYLPDTRFNKYLKKCRRKIKTCQDIQEYIIPLLGESVFNSSISKSEEQLRKIKTFIINLFDDSKYIGMYQKRLSQISVTEVGMDELYLQQLPTIFNEEEMLNCSRKVGIYDLQKAVSEKYSIIMLFGTVEESLLYMFEKAGVTNEFSYDKGYCSTNEFVAYFDLRKKEVLTSCGTIEAVDKILLSPERRSVLVTSYKNYDFTNNHISIHENLDDDLFVYCDRTYANARCYLDLWKEQEIYYRSLQYNEMIVLIIKLTEKNYFLLPMTSIVAVEAELDIKTNRKNMKMCHSENDFDEEFEYDTFIIKDEVMRDKIDTIINSLFFITEK